jgi:alpha-L-rhamnosidase
VLDTVLIGVAFTLVAGVAMASDVFEGAEWLRDPVFEGVETADIYHKQQVKAPKTSGPRNVHSLLRKEVTLEAAPRSAMLHITGDDYYKFHVNGTFVVQGPEPGYPFAHPYYSIDIARFLDEGVNCLAAHAYYQGLNNRVWNSAENRAGFMLALDVTFDDGRTARFVTDDSWRLHRLEAFPAGETIGYKTQFTENVDMRAIPVGWREAGFDDSSWMAPLVGRQDHVFVEQLTPPLQVFRMEPKVAKRKGDGHYFYDLGTEVVGCTRIRVKGDAGQKIEVRHGEELLEPDTVRYDMRAKCLYQEFPVLSGREEVVEFYDYRAFRYIEVLNAPGEPEVWVDARHHPFAPDAVQFSASDGLLEDIWELCKNGVRWGAQGGFLDCPSREKGQYLGDALITGHSHLVLTGDGSLVKKALQDFQHSQKICPGIMAVAPGSFMQEIAEYSLQWPMVLRNYFLHTGDRAFAEAMADAAFEDLYGYFARFESDAGLITGMTEKWVLVDWPDNLRDGYDYDYAKERENTVLNAFYYGSLCAAGDVLEGLGREASAYRTKAEKVKQAFLERMFDADKGLFVDAPGSEHASLHANAIPLAFGMVPEEHVAGVVALIREKRLSCGVYIAPFVIAACYEAGEPELAYDLITSKDEHSWHEMLKHGATTCMEAWGPDQKWNTSWCHPWSSGPIFLIAHDVMGLRPAEPGWEAIHFAPHIPASVDHAEMSLPIPTGRVTVRYERDNGFTVMAPPDVPVRVEVPEGVEVKVSPSPTHAKRVLTEDQQRHLDASDWQEHVGEGLGLWVSVDEQMVSLIENGAVLWHAPCATAERGIGSRQDSLQTPPGWHTISGKIGDGAPWGQVFRSRQATREVWKPGQESSEDLVLTRVLLLAGEEPGVNQGGNVDSTERCIYIHGTNQEERIGEPSSHGCVRLRNDDVIEAFEWIPLNTPVLISRMEG